MSELTPNLRQRYFDDNGAPLAGGKLYSYVANTSTPKATYTDQTEDTENANPTILDADGYADVWLGAGFYKFILKDSDDNTLFTVDQVSKPAQGATGVSLLVGSGAPDDNDGTNGDFLLRTDTGAFYQKLSGTWGLTGDSLELPASVISFSNGASGLTADTAQEALDEIEARLQTAETDVDTAQATASDHIADPTAAHAASAIANTPSGNLAATNVQTALNELQSDIDTRATATSVSDHLADTADAHDASAISSVASGSLAATDVQAALNELQSDIDTRALASGLSDHLSDAADAHDASAISSVPSGNLAADDVQEALNELQTDIDTRATSTALTDHTGDAADAHDASAISYDNATSGLVADQVQEAIDELAASSSGGGGGAGLEWYFGDSNAPVEAILSNGLRVLDFSQLPDEQTMYVGLVVPSSYVPGTQILLTDGKFFSPLTSGEVLWRTQTNLLKAGVVATTDPLTATDHESTSGQQAVDPQANEIVEIGDIDLTNASGEINSVAVAPGDQLLVKFFRDTSSETSSLAGDARLIRASFQPKFTA